MRPVLFLIGFALATPAASGETPAAFGRRCIPAPTPTRWETRVGGPGADCVAPPSHIPDTAPHRARNARWGPRSAVVAPLRRGPHGADCAPWGGTSGRLAALGATPEFHYGLLAQSTFATLTGTVTDSSGAVLPGVTITVTNIGTEGTRSLVTDDVGNYLVPNLDAGGYRIVAALSGFAEQTRQTELLARQTVRVDLQLHVAGTREQVDGVGTCPVNETEPATIENSKPRDDS